jgi:hypothetical protein
MIYQCSCKLWHENCAWNINLCDHLRSNITPFRSDRTFNMATTWLIMGGKTCHSFKHNYVRIAYDSPENRYFISFLSNIYHLNINFSSKVSCDHAHGQRYRLASYCMEYVMCADQLHFVLSNDQVWASYHWLCAHQHTQWTYNWTVYTTHRTCFIDL